MRFDESMVWDSNDSAWGERNGWEGAFDHYRNAAVDAFGSGKIADSPTLSKQYQVAVGLLRGLVSRQLKASEVFDVEQMGQFMAVSDVFGSWHATAWHNMRFYLNPVTLRLEPIAYDITLQRRFLENESILNDDPFMQQVIRDPVMFASYQRGLQKVAEAIDSGELLADLVEKEHEPLRILRTEFRLLPEFSVDFVKERKDVLLQRYGAG